MQPQKILVIEDDPAIRQGIVDALRFEGYETLEAENGDDGSRMAVKVACDLLLLDLILPGRDGFEILREVRQTRPTLPVIILTHELQHRSDGEDYDEAPDTDGDHLPNALDQFPNTVNGAGYSEYTGGTAWMGDWEKNARAADNVTPAANKDWSEGGEEW